MFKIMQTVRMQTARMQTMSQASDLGTVPVQQTSTKELHLMLREAQKSLASESSRSAAA